MKSLLRFGLALSCMVLAAAVHAAGNLSYTLSPAGAVSAGAAWRVDGGSWQASGATVKGLSAGNHAVDFRAVSGWLAPASATAAVTNGSTTRKSATYVQTATLTITLSPTSAQWRVDGGVWQSSGAAVANLAPGTHTVDYAAVFNYVAPASESVTLAEGQNASFSRAYTALATLSVTLSPATAQWRVDSGPWQASGATVAQLGAGNHSVDYAAVAGYAAPASESVTLASGQALSFTRSYVKLGSVIVTLSPGTAQWRIDAGAWLGSGTTASGIMPGTHSIDYAALAGYIAPASESVTLAEGQNASLTRAYTPLASLTVNLTPGAAQWRVDAGAWQASGATVGNLSLGTHAVEYAPASGYLTPATENVNLASGANTLSRTYTPLASVTVNLTPNWGSWRVDGGAWLASGTTVSNLSLAAHTLDYLSIESYVAPASETLTLPSGNTSLTRAYVPLASLTVSLDPSNARWRIDGGAWQSTTSTLHNLSLGTHSVDFEDVWGYDTPSSVSVTLVSGPNSLAQTYRPRASLTVSLNPDNAQWRVDGGPWWTTSAVANNLSLGTHTVEFGDVWGYDTPAPLTVTLVSGMNSVSQAYTARASLSVALTPNNAQWRVDGGPWWTTSAVANNLSLGTHTVEFSDVWGYDTPAPLTVTLVSGMNSVSQSYTARASLTIDLSPDAGQWRIDGGPWWNRYTTANNLSLGSHRIEYQDIWGYDAPPAETITLVSGPNAISRSYVPRASLTLTLDPDYAQWRVDGGSWFGKYTTVNNLALGSHLIEYSSVPGYLTPAAETVTLVSGLNSLSRSFAPGDAYVTIKSFADFGAKPSIVSARDGSFFGFSNTEGGNGAGVIFHVAADGSNPSVLCSLYDDTGAGAAPTALLDSGDGFLYGAAANGGATTANGTIFRLGRDGTGRVALHVFADSPAVSPNALIEASDARLYGTSAVGGAANAGVVFALAKDGSGYAVLMSFAGGADGQAPLGVVEGPDGVLYGSCGKGGASALGTLFRINRDGSGYVVLKSFAGGADGASPRAGLTVGSDGLLYGSTAAGGSAGKGLLFRIDRSGSNYTVIHHLPADGSDGVNPSTPLTEGAPGVFFGTTLTGGPGGAGTVFRMNADGTSYSLLKAFTAATDGGGFNSSALIVRGSSVFGATFRGVTGGCGGLFSLGTDGSNFQVLQPFGAPSGSYLLTPLAETIGGDLCGTARLGGASDNGVIYAVSKDGQRFRVLHLFAANENPSFSQGIVYSGGVVFGAAGQNLFSLYDDGSGYAVLHTFGTGTDGSSPQAVTLASDGVIYGTTGGGGASGVGTIFKINQNGTGYAAVRSFAGGTADGAYPYAMLTEGSGGRLFGTTSAGGAANAGTVFVINKDGTGYGVLKQFAGGASDGSAPWAAVTPASDGNLYGVTSAGGAAGLGTIYRVAADGSGSAVLHHFAGGTSDGASPGYATVVDNNGALYGVTSAGGTFGHGVLYRINYDGTGFTVLVNFGLDQNDGSVPAATLVRGSNGLWYGTTARGGHGSTVYQVRLN